MAIQFRPIDAAARDGASHLVRDDEGMQHCARWDGTTWRYGQGPTVAATIKEYAVNTCRAAGVDNLRIPAS